MSDPQRVLVHVRYPDDPPVEMVYREDGSIEQVAGWPGIVMGRPVVVDGPTMTVRVEHSAEGATWTDLVT